MNTKLTFTLSLVCLSTTLLTPINPVFALSAASDSTATDTAQPTSPPKETTSPADAKPSATVTEPKEEKAEGNGKSEKAAGEGKVEEEGKQAEQAKTDAPAKKTFSLNNPPLESAIKGYIEAWQKQDLKTMYTYESWEGGNALDEIGYIKAIDTNFRVHTWQITQAKTVNEQPDQYEVFVMVTHNPPAEVAALVPPGLTVRSTLRQWWKKQGDKYVHLFNIERQTLLGQVKQMAVPPSAVGQPPAAQSPTTPPSAKPEGKEEEKKEEKK